MNKFLHIFFRGLVLQSFLLISAVAPQTASDWSQPLQPCWQFKTDAMSVFPLVSDQAQTIFVPLSDGSLVALETLSGKILWRSEFGGEIVAPPLFSAGKIFLLSRTANAADETFIFRAVSSLTGLTVLQKTLALRSSLKAYILANDAYVYVFSEAGDIIALDKTSGSHVWTINLAARIKASPSVGSTDVLAATEDKKITIISASDGTVLKQFELETPAAGDLQTAAGILFFGDRLGSVSALRLAEKKSLWKFRTGAEIVDLAMIGSNLLVTSNDGFVYMLSQKSGDKIWKHRLAGRSIGRVLLNHKFLLVQNLDGDVLPVIDSARGKVVNQVRLAPESFTLNGAAGGENMLVIPSNTGLQAFANRCLSAD